MFFNQIILIGDFVDRIYPIEVEMKATTDTARTVSYLELHLKIDKNKSSRQKR